MNALFKATIRHRRLRTDAERTQHCIVSATVEQESRAAARKPRDAAAVLFGLSSATTFIMNE